MQILDRYPLPPGFCSKCYTGNLPVVDTGGRRGGDPRDGQLYLCVSCVQEMGRLTGMCTSEEADELRAAVALAEGERDAVRSSVDKLKDRIGDAVDGIVNDKADV
jgi:hypothetical protein